MSRGLNATQIGFLEAKATAHEYLVEILYTTASDLFYTTGSSNVAVSTATSGGSQTFIANNQVSLISDIEESYELTSSNITLEIATSDQTFLTNLASEYKKAQVNVYVMFRNTTTNNADTTNIIQLFKGTISTFGVNGGTTQNIITINCSNNFTNFDTIYFQTASDIEPNPGGKFYWGTINVD